MRKGLILLWGILFLGLIIMLSLGCTGGGSSDSGTETNLAGESLLEEIIKRGELRVGMSTFVPWAMNDKSGNLIGFEIDVATRLAEDMGVKAVFIPTKWSGIIPALLTGKFDVIIGGMGIRPERNLKVNFSIPYDYTGMSLVAHKEKALGFGSLEDFNRPEVVITARIGTTAAEAVKKHLSQAQIRLFDDEAQAIQELLLGRAHGMVASAPLPTYLVLENPDTLFQPFSGTFTKEPIGFALPKGDPDLLNFFNSWITVVEAEGWLAERKHYWFESQDWKGLVQ